MKWILAMKYLPSALNPNATKQHSGINHRNVVTLVDNCNGQIIL
jgi:hypothetical protein